MKYNQPYGVSDPDASYTNGNPSTGTMGSIPPAASIEQPQREIVNFIADSARTPDGNDVRQMSKSVQSGHVNYALDQGTPNFIAITPTPAVVAYQIGLHFRIKVMNNNTGPVQVNVNNVGWGPAVHAADQSALGAGEIFTGQIIEITWDGTHWQVLSGAAGGGGGLIQMTAPRTIYLDANNGSDTLYDGASPTIDAPNKHGPFKTLRHAIAVMLTYNLGGWTFTIKMADGIYSDTSTISMPPPNGSGYIAIEGNQANPSAVKIINQTAGSTLSITGATYGFNGVFLQATAPGPNDWGSCISVAGNGSAWISAVAFGSASSQGYHLQTGPQGGIGIAGPVTVSGGGFGHIGSVQNGNIQTLGSPPPALTITTPISFVGAFVVAGGGGQMIVIYSPINGAGNVSGAKYSATGNGVVNCGGQGVNYFPGTVAGNQSSGGQYL